MQFSWSNLKSPIMALAPMEDVTDTVFRQIIAGIARPSVFFTEFTNVDGMFSAGQAVVNQRLKYTETERPLVAQIWGKNPAIFELAARRIAELGFDGIDINMGCPEKTVMKHGCGAALINEPALVSEIISATKEGAGNLPVSVKTRIGAGVIATETWIPVILNCKVAALTVHGRTAKEQSEVPTHWDEIEKVVKLRNLLAPETKIIGNGDVANYADGLKMCERHGVDGVMIGRGIFHNPWAFAIIEKVPTIAERLSLLAAHVKLFDETWRKSKHFPILKKYFKIYISDFDGAGNLRTQLMQAENRNEVEQILAKCQQ